MLDEPAGKDRDSITDAFKVAMCIVALDLDYRLPAIAELLAIVLMHVERRTEAIDQLAREVLRGDVAGFEIRRLLGPAQGHRLCRELDVWAERWGWRFE